MPDLGLHMVDDLAVQFQPLPGIGAMSMPVAGFKPGLSQGSEAVETLAEGVIGVVDDRCAHISQAAIGEAVGGGAWCGHKGILALLGGTWKDDFSVVKLKLSRYWRWHLLCYCDLQLKLPQIQSAAACPVAERPKQYPL